MKKTTDRRPLPIATMAACFAVGVAAGWWLHASGGPRPVSDPIAIHAPAGTAAPAPAPGRGLSGRAALPGDAGAPVATSGTPVIGAAPRGTEPGGAIEVLQSHRLRVPVDGVNVDTFKGAFTERRTGDGGHTHEAVDILVPRHTPVRAVEDGTIARLFDSKAGGHTIYQFDPTERFAYYYAHLDRYAAGLHDGQRIAAGEVIGYVGTSGNAPAGTPHLHFAIFELGPDKRWWKGEALDPYLVFKK
jgi:murein DD-endopeptidase MepM/ murein hydrolase activator NlpD